MVEDPDEVGITTTVDLHTSVYFPKWVMPTKREEFIQRLSRVLEHVAEKMTSPTMQSQEAGFRSDS